jgi:hypothetical protein
MNLTYVTAFIELPNYNRTDFDVSKYIANFFKIADQGVYIGLYISPSYYEAIKDKLNTYPNITILDIISYNDLHFTKILRHVAPPKLPEARNTNKDTLEYFTLINNKTYFIRDAVERNPYRTNYFAWIDFGIGHVFYSPDTSYPYLKKLATSIFTKNLLGIAGYNGKGEEIEKLMVSPVWRFLGGFLIGDRLSLLNFCSLAAMLFENFYKETGGMLTWEVNYWTWVELNSRIHIDWYRAGFNDSIIKIPDYFF